MLSNQAAGKKTINQKIVADIKTVRECLTKMKKLSDVKNVVSMYVKLMEEFKRIDDKESEVLILLEEVENRKKAAAAVKIKTGDFSQGLVEKTNESIWSAYNDVLATFPNFAIARLRRASFVLEKKGLYRIVRDDLQYIVDNDCKDAVKTDYLEITKQNFADELIKTLKSVCTFFEEAYKKKKYDVALVLATVSIKLIGKYRLEYIGEEGLGKILSHAYLYRLASQKKLKLPMLFSEREAIFDESQKTAAKKMFKRYEFTRDPSDIIEIDFGYAGESTVTPTVVESKSNIQTSTSSSTISSNTDSALQQAMQELTKLQENESSEANLLESKIVSAPAKTVVPPSLENSISNQEEKPLEQNLTKQNEDQIKMKKAAQPSLPNIEEKKHEAQREVDAEYVKNLEAEEQLRSIFGPEKVKKDKSVMGLGKKHKAAINNVVEPVQAQTPSTDNVETKQINIAKAPQITNSAASKVENQTENTSDVSKPSVAKVQVEPAKVLETSSSAVLKVEVKQVENTNQSSVVPVKTSGVTTSATSNLIAKQAKTSSVSQVNHPSSVSQAELVKPSILQNGKQEMSKPTAKPAENIKKEVTDKQVRILKKGESLSIQIPSNENGVGSIVTLPEKKQASPLIKQAVPTEAQSHSSSLTHSAQAMWDSYQAEKQHGSDEEALGTKQFVEFYNQNYLDDEAAIQVIHEFICEYISGNPYLESQVSQLSAYNIADPVGAAALKTAYILQHFSKTFSSLIIESSEQFETLIYDITKKALEHSLAYNTLELPYDADTLIQWMSGFGKIFDSSCEAEIAESKYAEDEDQFDSAMSMDQQGMHNSFTTASYPMMPGPNDKTFPQAPYQMMTGSSAEAFSQAPYQMMTGSSAETFSQAPYQMMSSSSAEAFSQVPYQMMSSSSAETFSQAPHQMMSSSSAAAHLQSPYQMTYGTGTYPQTPYSMMSPEQGIDLSSLYPMLFPRQGVRMSAPYPMMPGSSAQPILQTSQQIGSSSSLQQSSSAAYMGSHQQPHNAIQAAPVSMMSSPQSMSDEEKNKTILELQQKIIKQNEDLIKAQEKLLDKLSSPSSNQQHALNNVSQGANAYHQPSKNYNPTLYKSAQNGQPAAGQPRYGQDPNSRGPRQAR